MDVPRPTTSRLWQMAITGEHGVGEAELRHIRATYVTRENLRQAITAGSTWTPASTSPQHEPPVPRLSAAADEEEGEL